ncbi:DUF2624 family protein [Selenomonas sp. AB3002]|uniref:DUF2624 family protein n=1 Tax=Selenomonas sp. AB3002 TaxID=1392502 RepID=UPI00049633C6
MAKINVNELSREQIEKAMACETVEELMALAKAEGIELTKEEAEAYMAELEDYELDEATMKNVAGGLQGIKCQSLRY